VKHGASNRIRRFRINDKEGYMPVKSIAEIEELRHRANKYGLKAGFCLVLCGWLTSRAFHYFAAGRSSRGIFTAIGPVLLGLAAVGYSQLAWEEFRFAWAKFYGRRFAGLFDQLMAENYDFTNYNRKYAFGKWLFWRTKDLVEFEKTLCDYACSYRRAADLANRQAKWAASNARLTQQLVNVFIEWHVSPEDRREVLDDFSSYINPRRRKEFIESYSQRLIHQRWHELKFAHEGVPAGHQVKPGPMVSEEDLRLKSLEHQASRVMSDSARHYYTQALETDSRREKIRLFGRALNEDVRSAETDGEVVAAIATLSKTPSKAILNEVKHLSLQEFARERLVGLGQFARETEWLMWREIILALARPGQSGGRFNKHYFAEDTVKRMVRRQLNMYAETPFKPSAFDEAVSWLLKNGVLVTKPKVDERTLSLSTNVKNATPDGAAIILMILRLKREMSGLPN
jgi:hypothetical protein